MTEKPPGVKVAIVGAGSVGATPAYACLIRGVAHTGRVVRQERSQG